MRVSLISTLCARKTRKPLVAMHDVRFKSDDPFIGAMPDRRLEPAAAHPAFGHLLPVRTGRRQDCAIAQGYRIHTREPQWVFAEFTTNSSSLRGLQEAQDSEGLRAVRCIDSVAEQYV